jgi:hypothetical protein
MALNTLAGQNTAVAMRLVTGLSALGTSQATAYKLVDQATYEFTTVPAGSGAVLPVARLPSSVSIYNAGANTLAIYPAPGGTINGGSVNGPITLTAGSGITLWASSLSSWYTSSTGTAGSSPGTVTSIATAAGLTGGPITSSGTLAIAAGGVGTTQLAIAGVTYPKLQNVSAGALLGNPTGSAGEPGEITLGANLSFSGTTLVATGGGGGGSGTVTSIVAGAGLSGGTITTSGTLAIASSGVTYGNIQNVGASSLLGNPTGSAAAPSEITLAGGLMFSGSTLTTSFLTATALFDAAFGSTQGDTLYRGAATWGVLAPGTVGYVLTSGGASANPVWGSTGLQIDSHQGVITTDTYASTTTLNLATSDWHSITLTGNVTIALSNPTVGQAFCLVLIQGGAGSYTATWFTTIKWAGGTPPTLTTTVGGIDVLAFKCVSTGNYYGFVGGAALA